jgi:hypothetical protein
VNANVNQGDILVHKRKKYQKGSRLQLVITTQKETKKQKQKKQNEKKQNNKIK